MKPDWKDAPEWANYLAMDDNGEWYWFENEPKDGNYSWIASSGQIRWAPCAIRNWQESLEQKAKQMSNSMKPILNMTQEQLDVMSRNGWAVATPNEELLSLTISRLEHALAEASKDAERLNFVLSNTAWIQWREFGSAYKRCALMTQDEDEEYIYLSGINKYFATPRDAIDAAMKESKQ